MKKIKLNKLGINKATISHLTQQQINGGGTNTCHGGSCCPTEDPTCANTCANTCAYTCGPACGQETLLPHLCGGGTETIRTCPV